MNTVSSTYLPLDAHQPRGRRPWYADCDTDQHLRVDSIAMMNRRLETLAAAINCSKCGASRVLATTVAFIAAVLHASVDYPDGNAHVVWRLDIFWVFSEGQ